MALVVRHGDVRATIRIGAKFQGFTNPAIHFGSRSSFRRRGALSVVTGITLRWEDKGSIEAAGLQHELEGSFSSRFQKLMSGR